LARRDPQNTEQIDSAISLHGDWYFLTYNYPELLAEKASSKAVETVDKRVANGTEVVEKNAAMRSFLP
jgi:hypothetical protein